MRRVGMSKYPNTDKHEMYRLGIRWRNVVLRLWSLIQRRMTEVVTYLMKRRMRVLAGVVGAPVNKKLVCFVDDVNVRI